MSKRISNQTGQLRKPGERTKVKFGWRKRRMLSQMEKMEELDRMDKLEEKAKATLTSLRGKVDAIRARTKRVIRPQGR